MADDYILTHKAPMEKPQSSSTLNKNVEPFYPSDDGRQQMYSHGNARSRNSLYHLRRHPLLQMMQLIKYFYIMNFGQLTACCINLQCFMHKATLL